MHPVNTSGSAPFFCRTCSMPEQIISSIKAEEVALKLMRLLHESPDLTQREQAEKLGISVGALNYCLKALMAKGLVKMQNFVSSKNKFGYVYVLTPSGLAEKAAITHRFLQRKMNEYEVLKTEIEALKIETANLPQGSQKQ